MHLHSGLQRLVMQGPGGIENDAGWMTDSGQLLPGLS